MLIMLGMMVLVEIRKVSLSLFIIDLFRLCSKVGVVHGVYMLCVSTKLTNV